MTLDEALRHSPAGIAYALVETTHLWVFCVQHSEYAIATRGASGRTVFESLSYSSPALLLQFHQRAHQATDWLPMERAPQPLP